MVEQSVADDPALPEGGSEGLKPGNNTHRGSRRPGKNHIVNAEGSTSACMQGSGTEVQISEHGSE